MSGDGEGSYLPPSMANDVRNAIAQSMAENGTDEKPGALESLPTPNIEDLFEARKSFMSDNLANDLSKPVTSLVEQNDDGVLNQVRYLGKQTTEENVNEAIQVVTDRLEELSSAGFIEGALLPLSMFKMTNDVMAVISYVMLNPDGVEYFDEHMQDISISEGGAPTEI